MKVSFAGMTVLLLIVFGFGCGQSSHPLAARAAAEREQMRVEPEATAEKAHSHEGWWCDEHGVPEQICALCDPKVAAKLKKEGDWCKEHDVPESQCFSCHPEWKAKFTAQYVAKYGKQPPETDLK